MSLSNPGSPAAKRAASRFPTSGMRILFAVPIRIARCAEITVRG